MKKVHLTIAIGDYDHVRDFTRGEVEAQGIEVTHIDLSAHEIFSRFTRFREWDVSEMSMARYIALISQGDQGLTAIPVFPSRLFRQSAIFVESERPIEKPEELAGKRVGVPAWVQSAGVYARAYLMHQVGIRLTEIEWFQAGVNLPGRVDEVAPKLPAGVRYTPVPNRSLTEMLLAGELDAIIAARPPRLFEEGDPRIRRLFVDFRGVEEAYWHETGIFPIMHTVALRRDVVERYPWVSTNLFKAFEEAKGRSLRRTLDVNICRFPLPWCRDHAERSRAMFGADFWPYGVEANRTTLKAFAEYAYEQGVTSHRVSLEELFPDIVHGVHES